MGSAQPRRLIGGIHDVKVVDALIALLEDKDNSYFIREAAHDELKSMTGKDFTDNPGAWRHWWDTSGREEFENEDR